MSVWPWWWYPPGYLLTFPESKTITEIRQPRHLSCSPLPPGLNPFTQSLLPRYVLTLREPWAWVLQSGLPAQACGNCGWCRGMAQLEVLSSVVCVSSGGEMEGKKVADEVLRVAPLWAVSGLWGTRGRSPEYRDLGGGTVRHCGECGPPKWHLYEEHGPVPKTHSDWVCTPGFFSSYWALPSQQNVESLWGQYYHTLIILFRIVTSISPTWPVSIHDWPLWANHRNVSLHPPAQIAQLKFSTLYCGRGSARWQQKGIKGVFRSLLTIIVMTVQEQNRWGARLHEEMLQGVLHWHPQENLKVCQVHLWPLLGD